MAKREMKVSFMTLGAFIENMKKGWGFRCPGQVMRIGNQLARIFPDSDVRGKVVRVIYEKDSSGNYYYYSWTVDNFIDGMVDGTPADPAELHKFIKIEEGRFTPNRADELFGYETRNLPFIRIIDGGFVVSFRK